MVKSFPLVITVIIAFCNVALILAQTEDDIDCPNVGVIYYPHTDCTKYIVCDNGNRIVLECPISLYYNPLLEQCDYPRNVPECVGGTRPPPPEGNTTTVAPPTTIRPTNATTATPPSNSTSPSTISTPITTYSTTQNPPTNSTSTTRRPTYSTSTTRRPTNSTTPRPTNSTTLRPTNSTTPRPTNSTTPRPTNSTTFMPTTPPTNLTTWNPPINSTTPSPPDNGTTPLPNGCPPTGLDKVPHPDSCSMYLICANGVAYEEECADGLLFNPALKECDFQENVNCTVPGPTTTPETPLPECPAEGVSFHPYPGNCTLYIICVEGFPMINTCAAGTCFDEEALQCLAINGTLVLDKGKLKFYESSSNYYLSTVQACNKNPEGLKLVASTSTCKEYSICNGGIYKGTLECQIGYHFDFNSQTCVSDNLSTCLL